jgi:hypothetical protein
MWHCLGGSGFSASGCPFLEWPRSLANPAVDAKSILLLLPVAKYFSAGGRFRGTRSSLREMCAPA